MSGSAPGGTDSGVFGSFSTTQLSNLYKYAVKFGVVDFALHPLDFADTLIRLGYEPFPPVEQESYFQGKTLALPSLPAYVYYLYLIDGFSGLYRGVIPHVAEALINRHLTNYLEDLSPFSDEAPSREPPMMEKFTEGNVAHFIQTRFWRLISNVITIHVSYPFHVIAVRIMARFVTTATSEEGVRPPMSDIWFDELLRVKNMGELFAGCQARILREILFCVISAGTFLTLMKVMHFLQPDVSQAERLEGTAETIGNTIASMYTSPFKNASDIMIINQTDIPLGNPPFIEPYTTCWDCVTNLRTDKYWKGAPLLGNRYYTGPKDLISDRLYPRDTMFGPYYLPEGPQYQRGVEDLPHFLQIYYDIWKTMGARPGMDMRRLEEIVMGSRRGPDFARGGGSIALTGVKSFLTERHEQHTPFLLSSSSYGHLKGNSNPFGL